VVIVTLSDGTTEAESVTSSTANTLKLASPWGTTPSPGDAYVVSTKVGYTKTVLVDASKSWTPNQWAGDVVTVTLPDSSKETGLVAGNSANTMTMTAPWGTVPSAGNAYVVSALGYTTNTLVDTSKNWTPGQWAGDVVTVTLPDTSKETGTVASNTAHMLTMSSPWTTVPSAGDAYVVSSIGYTTSALVDTTKSWGTNVWNGAVVSVTLVSGSGAPVSYTSTSLTDTSRAWIPNQWAGTTVQVTLGDGTQETDTVTTNSATTLTLSSAWGTTPSAGNLYAITETGTVAGNTSHTLTMSAPWTTIPASGSPYSVVAAVVLYLACPTSAPFWSCDPAGQSGGSVSTSGSGTFAVTAAVTGPYAGIALFTDPYLIDPSGGYVVSVAGNGGSFGGTVYAPRGTVSISGGGSTGSGVNVGGRVIVQDLLISGNSASILTFTGPAPAIGAVFCYYYTDSLSGIQPSGGSQAGDVRFESACSSAGLNGQGITTPSSIINFDYGGP
jgi:hypothetical protein